MLLNGKGNGEQYILVYLASSDGNEPSFREATIEFGRCIARSGYGLVYGGGILGHMGLLADSVKDHGGRVIAVVPEFLIGKEGLFTRADEKIIVPGLDERKRVMLKRGSAVVALPGGNGTLEETVQAATEFQLGLHEKPILFCNTNGFWNHLLALYSVMHAHEFINDRVPFTPLIANNVREILPMLTGQMPSWPLPAVNGSGRPHHDPNQAAMQFT